MRLKSVLVGLLLALLAGVSVFAQGPLTPSAAVTGTVYQGRTPLVPKFIKLDVGASGDNVVINGVAAKKIRVLAATLTMTGTLVTMQWKSGTGATEEPLTGAMGPLAGQTIVYPFNPVGWFEASTATLLNLELGGAQSVDGMVVYVLVDP